ncbi:Translin-associated protein X [Candida viswanathii]|uniref:Translin-associated protein X n=1 Tax=Candida viswanathii TaxID=5486 RepID=A0A367XPX2_9ASCO|nr:Translin-associated protein X [Candida viswanathii]
MSDFATAIFIPARDMLREKQDEREEIIRLCRDITSYSKKGIFSLHRGILRNELTKELLAYFEILSDRLAKIEDMYPNNVHLRGTISGAIEELIEFFTFGYYKYNFELLGYKDFLIMMELLVQGSEFDAIIEYLIFGTGLPESDHPPTIEFIDVSDYLMGIFDCTGEIMRLSILQLSGSKGNFDVSNTWHNYKFLQQLYEQYILLTEYYPGISINRGVFDNAPNLRGNTSFNKKLQVFESSIKKIEATLLDILVSDQEII